MSVYSTISKIIGWKHQEVAIPTKEKADEFLNQVKRGNQTAFLQVFKVYRFATTPSSDQSREAFKTICQAYELGCTIFK